MPKEVDHDKRGDEILSAVAGLVADAGLRGLTIRSLANRLGGSVSMVTHYFPTRHSLLASLGPWLLKRWESEIESLTDLEGDPLVQLRSTLAWLIPLTPEALVEEKAGLSLLTGNERDAAAVHGLRQELDAWARELVRSHVDGLVDDAHLEPLVDMLYAVTRGISVSACEAEGSWPPERQMSVLDDLLDLLDLLPANQSGTGRLRDLKIDAHGADRNMKEGA